MTELSVPLAWREGVVHSAYVRMAIALTEGLGLSSPIHKPEGGRMMSLQEVEPLLEVLGVAHNPGLGIALGTMIPASAHGAMGYAVVSSQTIGLALETLARFTPMRNRLFSYECTRSLTETVLWIKPRMALGPYREFCEIGTAVSVFKMIQSVAGDAAASQMCFDACWAPAMDLGVPMKVRLAQTVTALRVPTEIANLVSSTADAKLFASACRSCEEELRILDGSMVQRLRTLMPDPKQRWPSLKEAAAQFAMSSRTLMRRLSAEGFTYQSLQDEVKSELACWYLSNTPLPMSGIAEKLGFVDDTNFSRSFRRWKNTTPLAYRKSAKASTSDAEGP